MEDLIHALLIIFSFGAIFLIIMTIEHKVLIKQGQAGYDLPETAANIASSVLYKVMDGVYIVLFLGTLAHYVHSHGLQIEFEFHWYTYVLIFLVQDFLFYIWHFLAHKIRLAWVPHKIHHSSNHFNFGVALRQSAFAPLSIFSIVIWVPLVFLGFDIKVLAVLYEFNLFYQFFIHTKTIGQLPRPIEFIMNTPSHHRVHHGCAPAQIDCNFAGVFIIWDRIFGTFVAERDAGTIVYGVKSRPVHTNNVWVMVTEELFDLVKCVWVNKDVRHLWKSPDWQPTERR